MGTYTSVPILELLYIYIIFLSLLPKQLGPLLLPRYKEKVASGGGAVLGSLARAEELPISQPLCSHRVQIMTWQGEWNGLSALTRDPNYYVGLSTRDRAT